MCFEQEQIKNRAIASRRRISYGLAECSALDTIPSLRRRKGKIPATFMPEASATSDIEMNCVRGYRHAPIAANHGANPYSHPAFPIEIGVRLCPWHLPLSHGVFRTETESPTPESPKIVVALRSSPLTGAFRATRRTFPPQFSLKGNQLTGGGHGSYRLCFCQYRLP